MCPAALLTLTRPKVEVGWGELQVFLLSVSNILLPLFINILFFFALWPSLKKKYICLFLVSKVHVKVIMHWYYYC